MEAVAYSRYQRYGRRKVGQVLDEIRGKDIQTAQAILAVIPRRAATPVGKTMRSAAANLSVKLGRKVDLNSIWIKSAGSDKGPMKPLKRIRPGPMGRAMPYKRKMCHITIVVTDGK